MRVLDPRCIYTNTDWEDPGEGSSRLTEGVVGGLGGRDIWQSVREQKI